MKARRGDISRLFPAPGIDPVLWVVSTLKTGAVK